MIGEAELHERMPAVTMGDFPVFAFVHIGERIVNLRHVVQVIDEGRPGPDGDLVFDGGGAWTIELASGSTISGTAEDGISWSMIVERIRTMIVSRGRT